MTLGLPIKGFSSRQRIYGALLILNCVGYLIVTAHTPLSIMVWQSYDDQLFVKLGQSVMHGKWLGDFNELTLVKGPGYPLFLGINSWLGLPISLAHGLFYCVSLGVLSWVILQVSKSSILAVAVFVLPLWHPKLFEVGRIMRDMIYTSQAILFFAIFIFSLFVAQSSRRQVKWAVVAGLILGWFWLTREEGIWVVPTIVFLVAYSMLRNGKNPESRNILWPIMGMCCAFGLVQFIFYSGNFLAYGKFIGVDIKESNFRSALSAMESVRVGPQRDYLSVPREVREKLYAISPSFFLLKKYLDPEGSLSPWEAGNCRYAPDTCGDIGTGWFMWALRDAAAKAGFFQSPQKASQFFAAITEEIEGSCEKGILSCEPNFIPYVPPITSSQIQQIPSVVRSLLKTVVLPEDFSNFYNWKITGPPQKFHATLAFLNFPHHYPMSDPSPKNIELAGWYYDPHQGDQWFSLRVADQEHKNLHFSLQRNNSPDLVESFQDKKAAHQRFNIKTLCGVNCTVTFSNKLGKTLDLLIENAEEIVNHYFLLGTGTLAFDLATIPKEHQLSQDVRHVRAKNVQNLLFFSYRIFLPVLLIVALGFFIFSCYLVCRRGVYPIVFGLAAACWIAILSRAIILVLVDITAFPGVTTVYLYPIFSLSVIAACLSLGTVAFLLRGETESPSST